MSPLREYAFDLRLDAALRVRATSHDEAVQVLRERLDCAAANLGAWADGSPIIAEVTMNESPDLYEVDGEPATFCPGCGAIEGEPEWGTVGDGHDGHCPSCADELESGELDWEAGR